jgi:hypothetical protein
VAVSTFAVAVSTFAVAVLERGGTDVSGDDIVTASPREGPCLPGAEPGDPSQYRHRP